MRKKNRRYYRDLAIQAGEEFGALMAECMMCPKGSADYLILYEDKVKAFNKMSELAERAKNFIETPDYET